MLLDDIVHIIDLIQHTLDLTVTFSMCVNSNVLVELCLEGSAKMERAPERDREGIVSIETS